MFKLVEAYSQRDYTEYNELSGEPEIVLFDTGVEARDKAQELNETAWLQRVKFQPRKLEAAPNVDWKAREQARLDSGEYRKVPDYLAPYCKPEHYVHISTQKDRALAYTANDEKGRRDIQTRINPASYLEKFAPQLDRNERQELANRYALDMATLDLKWAVSADEIVAAYTYYDGSVEGVNESCMRYPPSHWRGGVHPCRVYGDSDLKLAYMTNDSGETIARCLVYEDRKVYSRVYGKGIIHDALKALGYKKSSGYYDDDVRNVSPYSLQGAKIQAIKAERSHWGYVMPYIDEASNCSFYTDSNGKLWFQLDDSGNVPAQNTGGITGEIDENEDEVMCEHCHSYVPEDEITRVATRLFSNGTPRYHETWCESCSCNDSTYSEVLYTRFDDSLGIAETEDNEVVPQAYADANLNYCQHCERYSSDNMTRVYTCEGTDSAPETWSEQCARDHAFRDEGTGLIYADDVSPSPEVRRFDDDGIELRNISQQELPLLTP